LQRNEYNKEFSLYLFDEEMEKSVLLFDGTSSPKTGHGFKTIAWSDDPDIVFLEAFVFDDARRHEGVWAFNIRTKTFNKLNIDPAYTVTPMISMDRKYLTYTSTTVLPRDQLHGTSEILNVYSIDENQSTVLYHSDSPLLLLGWTYDTIIPEWKTTEAEIAELPFGANITLYLPWASGITRCVTRDGSDTPPGTPGAGAASGYGSWCDLGNHSYPAAYDFDTNNFSNELVLASAPGEVVVVSYSANPPSTGYGNQVVIKHSNNYRTRYAHLASVNVAVGDMVDTGCFIGYEGTTGGSNGDHIHYEYEYPGGASGNLYHDFADCSCYTHKGYTYTSANIQGSCTIVSCPPNQTITTNSTGTISVGDYIISSGGVATGNSAVYDAGGYVELIPGFEGQAGCVFEGKIGGCTVVLLNNPNNQVNTIDESTLNNTTELKTEQD